MQQELVCKFPLLLQRAHQSLGIVCKQLNQGIGNRLLLFSYVPYMDHLQYYITEIIKRLYNSKKMRELFPDDRARLDHILENQVFGIAPTEIIYQIATHFILGFNDEIGQGCKTNFVMVDSAALAKEGKLAEFVGEKFGDKLEECCWGDGDDGASDVVGSVDDFCSENAC